MTKYTDEDLALMHADGMECPADDPAREPYRAPDQPARTASSASVQLRAVAPMVPISRERARSRILAVE